MSAPSAPNTTSSPALSTPQLLTNPSFETGGIAGWTVSPGANEVVYDNGTAAQGARYLETNTGTAGPGASVYQDVAFAPAAGHGYRATVSLRSPSGQPAPVTMTLWALGGTNPSTGQALPSIYGSTNTTVTSTGWTQVSAELDVPQSGYSDLRFQVYLPTSGVNLDLDAAVLQDTGLTNASFEQQFTGWSRSAGVNVATYGGGAEDNDYLETNAAAKGEGISQDVAVGSLTGHGYRATMLLRSPAAVPISVAVVLTAIGGTKQVATTTAVVSSAAWQRYSVSLDVTSGGHTGLRVGAFFATPGPNLDVDAVQLEPTGLTNSGFEDSPLGTGWQHSSGENFAVYTNGQADEGNSYLETNTGSGGAGGSVSQVVSTPPLANESYTGSLALRSPTGTPASVHLVLTALDGSTAAAKDETDAVVSSGAWSTYSVDLDVPTGTYTALELQLVVETAGVNVDLDAAELLVPVAPSVSTTSDCRPSNSCAPATFSTVLLSQSGIAAPTTAANIYAMETWERAEGGGAGCPGQAPGSASNPWTYSEGPSGNPINTTQSDAGSLSPPWNSVGVQRFGNADGQTCWYWGIYATAVTLVNGYYTNVLQVLRNPVANQVTQCQDLAVAVGDSPWGTGNFSEDC